MDWLSALKSPLDKEVWTNFVTRILAVRETCRYCSKVFAATTL
uniref:Transposase n=1 Tax=Heterorhabditis bacteriophora TaxID=37862 RepID=A0A1I7WTE4_HETBA